MQNCGVGLRTAMPSVWSFGSRITERFGNRSAVPAERPAANARNSSSHTPDREFPRALPIDGLVALLSRAARYESTVIASGVSISKLRYSVLTRRSSDFFVGKAETVADRSGYDFVRFSRIALTSVSDNVATNSP